MIYEDDYCHYKTACYLLSLKEQKFHIGTNSPTNPYFKNYPFCADEYDVAIVGRIITGIHDHVCYECFELASRERSNGEDVRDIVKKKIEEKKEPYNHAEVVLKRLEENKKLKKENPQAYEKMVNEKLMNVEDVSDYNTLFYGVSENGGLHILKPKRMGSPFHIPYCCEYEGEGKITATILGELTNWTKEICKECWKKRKADYEKIKGDTDD